MPVSTTPTTTSRDPSALSHAGTAWMSAPGVPAIPSTVCPIFSRPQSSGNRGSFGSPYCIQECSWARRTARRCASTAAPAGATSRLRDRTRQRRPAPTGESLSVSISARSPARSALGRSATRISPGTAGRPRNVSNAARPRGGPCAGMDVGLRVASSAAIPRAAPRAAPERGPRVVMKLDCRSPGGTRQDPSEKTVKTVKAPYQALRTAVRADTSVSAESRGSGSEIPAEAQASSSRSSGSLKTQAPRYRGAPLMAVIWQRRTRNGTTAWRSLRPARATPRIPAAIARLSRSARRPPTRQRARRRGRT